MQEILGQACGEVVLQQARCGVVIGQARSGAVIGQASCEGSQGHGALVVAGATLAMAGPLTRE